MVDGEGWESIARQASVVEGPAKVNYSQYQNRSSSEKWAERGVRCEEFRRTEHCLCTRVLSRLQAWCEGAREILQRAVAELNPDLGGVSQEGGAVRTTASHQMGRD